jgi:hypothetical protein
MMFCGGHKLHLAHLPYVFEMQRKALPGLESRGSFAEELIDAGVFHYGFPYDHHLQAHISLIVSCITPC